MTPLEKLAAETVTTLKDELHLELSLEEQGFAFQIIYEALEKTRLPCGHHISEQRNGKCRACETGLATAKPEDQAETPIEPEG